ncbi:MAG TPA: nucleoside hydrolase [Solirubrobacteraceae bacterium]|nr:nucleoside hydrolase [Solirubrobacteraceae bacterium]
MAPTPVIIDCDPGHDDMLAIMLAAAHPAVELLGITTVAGNGTLERTTANARATCALAGIRDVPIAAGAPRPLVAPPRIAADVHGESALEGAELPSGDDVPLQDVHAVELIARLVREAPGPVTLIPTGPLTNVAMFARRHPELLERVEQIVLMGGTMGEGNTTPVAEFNIVVDPEAADIVVTCGVPVTICGLDVTHQALATPDVLARLEALGTPVAATVVQLLRYFGERYAALWGFPSPPVHDPVAVARVIDPAIVGCEPVFAAIELTGTHTRGATVCDRHGRLGREPNALVATTLDADRFWALIVDALATLGR